jgi:heme-degrading monooxygenase HmoA
MIVGSNRIPVAPDDEAALAERLADRVGLVEQHPGFVRSEVLRPAPGVLPGQETTGAAASLILTYWARAEDFVAWTASDDCRRAHGPRAPADAFSGPAAFEVHELVRTTEGAGGAGTP